MLSTISKFNKRTTLGVSLGMTSLFEYRRRGVASRSKALFLWYLIIFLFYKIISIFVTWCKFHFTKNNVWKLQNNTREKIGNSRLGWAGFPSVVPHKIAKHQTLKISKYNLKSHFKIDQIVKICLSFLIFGVVFGAFKTRFERHRFEQRGIFFLPVKPMLGILVVFVDIMLPIPQIHEIPWKHFWNFKVCFKITLQKKMFYLARRRFEILELRINDKI